MTGPDLPPGLRPLGQPDARLAAAYRDTVPAGLASLTGYFAALAGRDPAGLGEFLHFPLASFEGIEPVIVADAAALRDDPPPSLDVRPGSAHLQPGSYDLLDEMSALLYAPTGIGCSLSYSRYDARGQLIGTSDGVYGIACNDGRWGIQWMSAIFTPAAAVGVRYADAAEAALRRNRDWMLGYSRRDQDILNSTQQFGRRAHLTLASPRDNARHAREGTPLAGYQVDGVHSRLRVSTLTPESLAGLDANFDQFASWAGGGVGPWAYTISWPRGRVLHESVDKTHSLLGYLRYTADHRLISETHSLSVATYRDGRWGSAGGVGVMMYHDRSNDEPGSGGPRPASDRDAADGGVAAAQQQDR
jgi:hypothetical protein